MEKGVLTAHASEFKGVPGIRSRERCLAITSMTELRSNFHCQNLKDKYTVPVAAAKRMWNRLNNEGQIVSLTSRHKSFDSFKLFLLRWKAGEC